MPVTTSTTSPIDAACRAARRAAESPTFPSAATTHAPRPIRVAIGDPQAPIRTFFAILHRHGLLADSGRLRDEVQLVSIGDHFDWGQPADRDAARTSGLELLSWLASHPADQVVILAGNHDLARVSELAGVSDDAFAAMQSAADRIYFETSAADETLKTEFRRLAPAIYDAELIARDFATFTERQRDLVRQLLETRRLRAAHAVDASLLLTHAGASVDDLDAAGVPVAEQADCTAIASALNAGFDAAVARWRATGAETAFVWERIHVPGGAEREGRGIFYHRPSNPQQEQKPDLFDGPPCRRFDVRRLPTGITQAVGHTADEKCRKMLGGWADAAPPTHGVLRHLRTDGRERVRYAHGTPEGDDGGTATMIFLDGLMSQVPVESYELLDLTTRRPYRRS